MGDCFVPLVLNTINTINRITGLRDALIGGIILIILKILT
jgi:hypothetical protein